MVTGGDIMADGTIRHPGEGLAALLCAAWWPGGGGPCRPELAGKRLERLGERGLVLPDPGVECLLVGADELLLVVCLDGEVDPGQVAAQRAVRVGHGHRDLRTVLRGGRWSLRAAWVLPWSDSPEPKVVQFVQRERVRIGGTEPVPGHAGRPVPYRLLELAVLDHVRADVVVQRLDDGHGASELGVVEVRQDVEALARGRLRPSGQVAERRAGRTGTRAGTRAGRARSRGGGAAGQEALLGRQRGPYVAPWPERLRERQAAVRAYRVRRLGGVLPVARVVHARGVQGVVRITGRQPVVAGGAEPGVGRERLRRQRRLGGGRGGRAADGGCCHRRGRSLGRRGRAGCEDSTGGEDWAAGQQAPVG